MSQRLHYAGVSPPHNNQAAGQAADAGQEPAVPVTVCITVMESGASASLVRVQELEEQLLLKEQLLQEQQVSDSLTLP